MTMADLDKLPMKQTTRKWSRHSSAETLARQATVVVILVFLGYSLYFMNVDVGRVLGAFGGLFTVIANRYYPPEIGYVTDTGYLAAILDTIQMSFLGATVGVILAIPLAWFSAYNVSPNSRLLFPRPAWSYLLARHP